MRLKLLGTFLLLALGAAIAIASPSDSWRSGREIVRAFQVQGVTQERGDFRHQQEQAQPDRRRSRDVAGQESSGYGGPAEGRAGDAAENARRQGRLSADERRALRRQIDEVGHDIYGPKR
ncbi:hypothetical protein ACFQUU_20700 [Herbaspirillum sp. GCM10030257]|uniref:hypothetical protein n=1 Tax=Herbaspirillum sp. GCM10030257 TaxID=3273393 RepID=UPI0036147654